MPRDGTPTAREVFAGLPLPRPDGAALRESVREMRAADGSLVGVLDDDPTGSQAVHGVQVVTVIDEGEFEAAFDGRAATCFVLTNSRSLDEESAVELTERAARGLIAVSGRRGARIQLVSRSDSTLRGHVIAEVAALQAVHQDMQGSGIDAVLFVPAFLEAGRLTAADIQWARIGNDLVPVARTEFARDPIFGYASSNLRDFIAEKSNGVIGRDAVHSIGLGDIRIGGPARVCELLTHARDGVWVVANATEYSDLETVACGVLLAERAGKSFVFRSGPSFVRALSGIEPRPPLGARELWTTGRRGGHGLIVVGSLVSQTNRQVAELRAGAAITEIELDASAIAAGSEAAGSEAAGAGAAGTGAAGARSAGSDAAGSTAAGAGDLTAAVARQVAEALTRSDVVLCTSRAVAAGTGQDSLAISRKVSAALSRVVRGALAARPAWILAKGGITSHDVAVHGLRIRRAEVVGQLLPGMISVFRPIEAAPEAIGMPYVVFAGNVGDDATLAQVVAILKNGRPAR